MKCHEIYVLFIPKEYVKHSNTQLLILLNNNFIHLFSYCFPPMLIISTCIIDIFISSVSVICICVLCFHLCAIRYKIKFSAKKNPLE